MHYASTTAQNILNETYSGLQYSGLPLAELVSLTSSKVTIDYTGVTRYTPQSTYEVILSLSSHATNIKLWDTQMTAEFKPKTLFVKKLLELRRRSIRDGMTTLSVDEILAEKHTLRGEID